VAIDLGQVAGPAGYALIGVVVGAVLNQVFQSRRDKKNDERAIRDRKADRLRASYAGLLLTVTEREAMAERWRWAAHDVRKLGAAEREASIKELIKQGRIEVDKTQIALQLESEAHGGDVLKIFETFNNKLTDTFSQVMSNIQDEKNAEPLGPVLQQTREARKQLSDTARKHLAELEQPL